MRFAFAAAAFAFATSVVASPLAARTWGSWDNCLSQAQANDIVAKFSSVLQHIGDSNATAQALLADGYKEYSDSILSLEGFPLGTVTFDGKQAYIGGVLGAPPVTGVVDLEIYVAGCTHVLWFWKFLGVGSGQYEVKGFNLFDVNSDLQVTSVYLEFNSIAWGLNTGYKVLFPGQ